MHKYRINWHEAAVCAIQIDLRDYSHILEYHSEYMLHPNHNRIDLLIIKKLTEQSIQKSIAAIFRSFNLFEIKGLHSTLTPDAYYKLNGHAAYYIASTGTLNQYNRNDISLTLLSFHHPKKLFRHLTKDCNKTIANPLSGMYYISNEMFSTQILVIRELSPEDSLYLSCLTDNLREQELINRLVDDYTKHQTDETHMQYMNLLTRANQKKGGNPMVCEGILNICGTSSKEIEERTKAIYIPQIQQLTNDNINLTNDNINLTNDNINLTNDNANLTNEISRLKELLKLHKIAY